MADEDTKKTEDQEPSGQKGGQSSDDQSYTPREKEESDDDMGGMYTE